MFSGIVQTVGKIDSIKDEDHIKTIRNISGNLFQIKLNPIKRKIIFIKIVWAIK